jgi:hypothetical protein
MRMDFSENLVYSENKRSDNNHVRGSEVKRGRITTVEDDFTFIRHMSSCVQCCPDCVKQVLLDECRCFHHMSPLASCWYCLGT